MNDLLYHFLTSLELHVDERAVSGVDQEEDIHGEQRKQECIFQPDHIRLVDEVLELFFQAFLFLEKTDHGTQCRDGKYQKDLFGGEESPCEIDCFCIFYEKPAVDVSGCFQIRRHEQYPGEEYEENGKCPLDEIRNLLIPGLVFHQTLEKHDHAVRKTPEDERVIRAMPDTCQKEYHEKIEVHITGTVSAERNIDIFFKPGAEGDVPSPPEFRDRSGNVGEVEVLFDVVSEDAAKADGDIRVSRKVIVDLEEIGQRQYPGSVDIDPGRAIDLYEKDMRAKRICNDQFLGISQDDPVDAETDLVDRIGFLMEFF